MAPEGAKNSLCFYAATDGISGATQGVTEIYRSYPHYNILLINIL